MEHGHQGLSMERGTPELFGLREEDGMQPLCQRLEWINAFDPATVNVGEAGAVGVAMAAATAIGRMPVLRPVVAR